MKFRALQLAWIHDETGGRLVQPGEFVESNEDLAAALAPTDPSRPAHVEPVYERVEG